MAGNLLVSWTGRAIGLGILAFCVMQGAAMILLVIGLLLFGHSSSSTANTAASVVTFAFAESSYFVSGLVAGRLASSRPVAHGALLGAICVVFNAAIAAVYLLMNDDMRSSTHSSVQWMIGVAHMIVPIPLGAFGGWFGGRLRRRFAP
jgi:hypothetical protein